jgi:polyisoprenoid-binding protein YceI
VLACAAHAAHAAEDWVVDRAASRLEFEARFEKAPAPGVFTDFDARLQFDPDKPDESRLRVKIATASADMRSASINRAIRSAEWFDCARYPVAEFVAEDVRRVEPDRYVARGVLNLKGVRRAMEVPFIWTRARQGGLMQGEFVMQRVPFGIGVGEWLADDVVGQDVKVRFRILLRRSG